MKAIEDFIKIIEKTLPEMITARNLVEIGLYNSPQAAYQARIKDCGPPYVIMPKHRVIYPRCGVIEFMRGLEQSVKNPKAISACVEPVVSDTSLNAQKLA